MTPRELAARDQAFAREAAEARRIGAERMAAVRARGPHVPDDGCAWGDDGITRKGCEFVVAMRWLGVCVVVLAFVLALVKVLS